MEVVVKNADWELRKVDDKLYLVSTDGTIKVEISKEKLLSLNAIISEGASRV